MSKWPQELDFDRCRCSVFQRNIIHSYLLSKLFTLTRADRSRKVAKLNALVQRLISNFYCARNIMEQTHGLPHTHNILSSYRAMKLLLIHAWQSSILALVLLLSSNDKITHCRDIGYLRHCHL